MYGHTCLEGSIMSITISCSTLFHFLHFISRHSSLLLPLYYQMLLSYQILVALSSI